jgi:hypothetical protein
MRIGLASGAIAVSTGQRLCRADDGFETNDKAVFASIATFHDPKRVRK